MIIHCTTKFLLNNFTISYRKCRLPGGIKYQFLHINHPSYIGSMRNQIDKSPLHFEVCIRFSRKFLSYIDYCHPCYRHTFERSIPSSTSKHGYECSHQSLSLATSELNRNKIVAL